MSDCGNTSWITKAAMAPGTAAMNSASRCLSNAFPDRLGSLRFSTKCVSTAPIVYDSV